MRLSSLFADRYRSIRREKIHLNDFILFIGSNGSGKSTVLDALRFLGEAVQKHDLREPVFARGGMSHLAWKGETADRVTLSIRLKDGRKEFEWGLRLVGNGYVFHVEEHLDQLRPGSPAVRLLDANRGEGWWRSGAEHRVGLKQAPTACALSAAAADASFRARGVAEFIRRWGFLDPSPFLLSRERTRANSARLDPYGRNLEGTLRALHLSSPETLKRITELTRSILGQFSEMEPRASQDRFDLVRREPELQFPIQRMGLSGGTLRMLALLVALHAEAGASLIGIEEPENHLHPTALSPLLDYLWGMQNRVQCVLTTHSPLLLDYLDAPEVVRAVQRDGQRGTTVEEPVNPDRVRRALEASGFSLGEFYETTGFGS